MRGVRLAARRIADDASAEQSFLMASKRGRS